MKKDIIKEYGFITIGSRLKRLSDRINVQISRIFKELKIKIEPSWLPVILYLSEQKSASIFEIASALNFTHPAAIHLVNRLAKNNLVELSKDDLDKRKTHVQLSASGDDVLNALLPFLEEMKISAGQIFNMPEHDFMSGLDFIERSLNEKNLTERTQERIKKKFMDSVEILKYSPEYKEKFKTLNIEWLQKYFEVEPEDERILNHPEEVISFGGEIFFAVLSGEIIGTCAVIKTSHTEFELAKMAVTEKAKGKQAGKKLALAAIGFAYSNGAKVLSLETSIKLTAAVSLYEKLGFEYVPGKAESKYKRETIRMKIQLV